MVFGHLDVSSQVCLGLTCKDFLRLLEGVDLKLERDKWSKGERFALLEQLWDWMPNELRLCKICLKYRPSDALYWTRYTYGVGVWCDSLFRLFPETCPECSEWLAASNYVLQKSRPKSYLKGRKC